MYYIIRISKDEYLFEYDLSNKEIDTTTMDIEARQFTSKSQADWIADRVGGTVVEITYWTIRNCCASWTGRKRLVSLNTNNYISYYITDYAFFE